MSYTVKEFPRRRRGRPPKYDWDRYFDGEIHVLRQGVDFQISPTSFRALVHRTANARGNWRAETQINKNEGTVLFKFVQEDE